MGESWNPTIQVPLTKTGIRNSASKTVLDSFTWGVFFVCVLSNRKRFRVCIAWYKQERGWENSRQLCKSETKSRVRITVENSPNASSLTHQSNPTAPSPLPPPGPLRGICLPCQSREWIIRKFCVARGSGICLLRGHP